MLSIARKTLVLFGVILAILVFSNILISRADEPSVSVKFEVLNGNGGGDDFYSGDWIYYNITMDNIGSSDIDATFTVSVYGPAGSVIGNVRDYQFSIHPNQTVILYPNNTRFSPTDVDAYFVDTLGTYVLNLTCDVPLVFYRYDSAGSYSWQIGYSHINVDVMPNYQRALNEQAQQFYEQTNQYVRDFETYVRQSQAEASKVQNLSIIAVVIASMSIVPSYYAIPKTRRDKKIIFLSFVYVGIFVMIFIILLT